MFLELNRVAYGKITPAIFPPIEPLSSLLNYLIGAPISGIFSPRIPVRIAI
jgi:hypothetical protein